MQNTLAFMQRIAYDQIVSAMEVLMQTQAAVGRQVRKTASQAQPSNHDVISGAVQSCIDRARAAKSERIAIDATEMLEEMANANPSLMKALTANAIHGICSQIIGVTLRSSNASLRSSAKVVSIGTAQSASRARSFAESTLMEYQLPGGKMLRDATHDDIVEAIGRHEAQIGAMQTTVLWWRAMLPALRQNRRRTVGQTLNEAKLSEMLKNARGEA